MVWWLNKVLISMLVLILIVGCSKNTVPYNVNDWEETGLIELETNNKESGEKVYVSWIGIENKIAISNNRFFAGHDQKYMWLLWGDKDELFDKDLRVTATHEDGKEITLFESKLMGPAWGATVSKPSSISLPSEGLWKLDAIVSNHLHGTLIVRVYPNESDGK
jgi:hypothetical protein